MARKKRGSAKKAGSTHFIVSKAKNPKVQLTAGMRLDVKSVRLLDPELRPSKVLAARLCGGTSTCLALVEVGDAAARGRTRA